MGAVLTRLLEVFYTKKLDIVVIGLENRYASFLLDHASCSSLCAACGEEAAICGLRISAHTRMMCLDEQIFWLVGPLAPKRYWNELSIACKERLG